jgi:AcrR family transcriptional regulator
MTRRDDIKAETRHLIQRAARKLFRKKGVEECTMRAVAKEAGVSAGTVILHFKNKTALLEVCISEDIHLALTEALATMPKKAALLKRLMHIPNAMYSFYDTDRELYRALVRSTVFEQEDKNPWITKQLNDYLLLITQILEEYKKTGTVRPDVDSAIAASSMASLYMGVLIHFFRNPEMTPEMANEMLRLMKQQYLKGLLNKKG